MAERAFVAEGVIDAQASDATTKSIANMPNNINATNWHKAMTERNRERERALGKAQQASRTNDYVDAGCVYAMSYKPKEYVWFVADELSQAMPLYGHLRTEDIVGTETLLDDQSANEVISLMPVLNDNNDDVDDENNYNNNDNTNDNTDDGFVDADGTDSDGDVLPQLLAFIGTDRIRACGGADEPRLSGVRDYGRTPLPTIRPPANSITKHSVDDNALHTSDLDSDSYMESTEGSFVEEQQLARKPTNGYATGYRSGYGSASGNGHGYGRGSGSHSGGYASQVRSQLRRLTFDDWLAGKKKMHAVRAAERRTTERDYKRAAEQRRRLSAQKYNEWLLNKARQARESLLARCKLNTNQLVRTGRPHQYLTADEMRRRVEEWERRKIIESERKRELNKQTAMAHREIVERRQRQAQEAWELWVASRAHAWPKGGRNNAINTKNASSLYVNPNSWHGRTNAMTYNNNNNDSNNSVHSYRTPRSRKQQQQLQQQRNYERHLQHQQQLQLNHQEYLKQQQFKEQKQYQQQQQQQQQLQYPQEQQYADEEEEPYEQYLQHEKPHRQ